MYRRTFQRSQREGSTVFLNNSNRVFTFNIFLAHTNNSKNYMEKKKKSNALM